MKVLQDNYLEQMTEELELINFHLDTLWESAVGAPKAETEKDDFSLLEAFDETPEAEILNEEAYALYCESLSTSLKSIWKAVARFIRNIFSSSGNRMTGKEIHQIVEDLKAATDDGNAGKLKNSVQKAFYIIAGLGSSVNGRDLKAAFDSGNTVNFVSRNINKIPLSSIPEEATFRICIATYEANVKNSMAIMASVFDILSKKGIKGIEDLGNATKGQMKKLVDKVGGKKNESADTDITDISFLEALDLMTEDTGEAAFGRALQQTGEEARKKEDEERRKYNEENPKSPLQKAKDKGKDAADRVETGYYRVRHAARVAAKGAASAAKDHPIAAAGAAVAVTGIVAGTVVLTKRARAKNYGKADDHIAMATITYMNESAPNAQAKIRMYSATGGSVKTFDIKGRDNVITLRDDLTTMADKLAAEGDKVGPGMKEYLMDFASNINTFFAGLATRISNK